MTDTKHSPLPDDTGHEPYIAELRRFQPAAVGGAAEPVIGVAATMLARKDTTIARLKAERDEAVATLRSLVSTINDLGAVDGMAKVRLDGNAMKAARALLSRLEDRK